MPFARPEFEQILDRALSDIDVRLPGGDSRLPLSMLGVIATVHTGAVHELHAAVQTAAKDAFITTASGEVLEQHGSVWGVFRREAIFAEGKVQFTGQDQSKIPAGHLLQRGDGQQYETLAESVIVGTSTIVEVRALEAGYLGTLDPGQTLLIPALLGGIDSTAAVVQTTLKGADRESDDRYRARILVRTRTPPRAGSPNDYTNWALEVSGVTRVWVFPEAFGVGTVGVTFTRDDDPAGIIPDAADVLEVQNYLDERRPVGARVTVLQPVLRPIDVTLQVFPDTPELRGFAEAELNDLFSESRDGNAGGTVYLTHIDEAISSAPGEQNHVLTVPAADVVLSAAEIPVLGTVTWL